MREINFEHKGEACIVSYNEKLLEKIPHEYIQLIAGEILLCVNQVENRKEETKTTLKPGDKVQHKKDKMLGTGDVKCIAESGLRAYVDFGAVDDWNKKRRFKPYPAYYLLEKLEKVEAIVRQHKLSEAEAE